VPPLVGDEKPSAVRAEISLDVSRLADNIRREWESLRPDDVVFLLAVQGDSGVINGAAAMPSDAMRIGLKYLRAAEVTQVLDDKGRSLRDQDVQANGHGMSFLGAPFIMSH
jgi:intron-binding protein aquarius